MFFSSLKNNFIATAIAGIIILSFPLHSAAQSMDKYSAKNWQLMDLAQDSVYGTSVTKAYNDLLKGKKSHQVIVAVIDAGLDTAHEDLQGHIWTNTKEIPGNNIDDDHNGYIDDVHGWNFLGGKDGRNITSESMEAYREYYRLRPLYSSYTDSVQVPADKKSEYDYWLKLDQSHIDDSSKSAMIVTRMQPLLSLLKNIDSTWGKTLNKDSVNVADIKTAMAADTASANSTADSLGNIAVSFYASRQIPDDYPLESLYAGGKDYADAQQKQLAGFSEDPNAARKDIVGDDPFNIKDIHYGNNNVDAGTPVHGTHVAGIIAALRNNGLGGDGITDNVLIMPVRAVPDGDERDKDIALAIRYAVDNGAEVINMSFGKSYSPGKSWVDEAVKYADEKDVLIVHAAGNDGKDIDTTGDYPSPVYLHSTIKAPNFITVGASTGGPDSSLAASFSNYGTGTVDVFAPGQNIYSTVPENKYEELSGTSMASPVVTGIAALILEYYPTLTAEQVKYVIDSSATKFPDDVTMQPGGDSTVNFSALSETGGIINAYNALKLAATLKGRRKM